MGFFYSIYGLGLQVDSAVAGLKPHSELGPVDVQIWVNSPEMDFLKGLAPTTCYESPFRDAQGEPTLRMGKLSPGGFFHLRYRDGTEFFLDPSGSRIWARAPAGAAPEELALYLLGPVLGFTLRLRGTTCLHASAVMVDDGAVAFVGPPGAGKSTLAVFLAQQGFPVLSDDIVPLQEAVGEFLAVPGSPRLCLWPEAVAHLFGSPEALPRLSPPDGLYPDWDKRCLALNGGNYRFQASPLPLAAIYILGESQAEGGLRVEPVHPLTGMLSLVPNTYRTELLDKDLRAQEFNTLARLAARVPLRRVASPAGLAHLPHLCEAILTDFRGLISPAARQEARSA